MTESKPGMRSNADISHDHIDSVTNASVRKMIGERLSQHLGTDAPMPDRLQRLLDQLRMQDEDAD